MTSSSRSGPPPPGDPPADRRSSQRRAGERAAGVSAGPAPGARQAHGDHPALVDLRAVEFRYPKFLLGPLTLRIDPGSAVALVGPNGAGKTTLLGILSGHRVVSAGAAWILGRKRDRVDPSVREKVDPLARHEALRQVHAYMRQRPDVAVVLATHILEDLDEIPFTRLLVLRDGKARNPEGEGEMITSGADMRETAKRMLLGEAGP